MTTELLQGTGVDVLAHQDQPEALHLLLAQRYAYGVGKRLRGFQALLTAVLPTFLGIFAPESWRPGVALSALLIIALDELQLDAVVYAHQKKGAMMQEAFDVRVFGLEWPSWRLAALAPEVVQECLQHARRAGLTVESEELRGWYPNAIKDLARPLAVLVCQRFNVAYGLLLRGLVIRVLLLLVLAAAFGPLAVAFACKWSVADLLIRAVLPMLPVLRWSWRELNRQKRQLESQQNVQRVIDRLARDQVQGRIPDIGRELRRVQDEILSLRTNDAPIFDWIYRLHRAEAEQTSGAAAENYVQSLLAEGKRS